MKRGLLVDQHLLQHLAGLPPDAHAWVDFVTGILRLPGSYGPAAYRVIGQNRWQQFLRRGQNALGYTRTATVREALKMGLAVDRYNPDEPRAPTKDQPPRRDQKSWSARRVPLPVPQSVDWSSREHCGATYSDDELGYQEHLDHLLAKNCERDPQAGPEHSIPAWLCLPDGNIDWSKVARYAVSKPHMACAVAEALKLRAEGWSRPRAIGNISSDLEAAFKWVDRHRDQIAQVLSLEAPPVETVNEVRNRRAKFVPPAEALMVALAKHKPQVTLEKAGPSIAVSNIKRSALPAHERYIETPAERLLNQRRWAWRRAAWFREGRLLEIAESFRIPTDVFDLRADGNELYIEI